MSNRILPVHRAGPAAAAVIGFLGLCALGLAPAGPARAASPAADIVPVVPAPAASSAGNSASASGHPRLVEFELAGGITLRDLLRQGFDVVEPRAGSAMVLAWPGDDARFARLGLIPRLLDADPGMTAARRARLELGAHPAPAPARVRSATRPDGRFRMESLPPFGAGSMGGYWTAAEIKTKLDQLVANDAQDLVADKVDTVGYSREGRPIWGLRIAKHVAGNDTRPVVFYSALTHAREPESMEVLFYFIDDLLSKYGLDPFATYLLDHRVLYIVPLVNPDGYAVNEQIYTSSGGASFGMWRKNTRDNNANAVFDQASDGVDLNRNFGVQWGIDNAGSSPDSSSETYRGPSAFSEVETRVQRDLVASLRPVTGFSLHTYRDLLLHPWGYTTAPTPDENAFEEWGDEFSRGNAYLAGETPAVLYEVNGEFNDWCYGDTLLKPRAYTWTPEIGSDADGFWPPPSRITPLAQEMLRPCYLVAAFAGPHVVAGGFTLLEGKMDIGRLTNIVVSARNLGARGDTGPLTGVIAAMDAGAHALNGAVSYPSAGPRVTVAPLGSTPFQVALDDTVTPGRLMRFQLQFTSASAFSRDTIVVPAGTPTVLFADDASSGTTAWTISPSSPVGWSVVMNDPTHPSRYFAQAGSFDYNIFANDRFILKQRLRLTAGVHAYAFYDAKWEYEQDYDSGSIEASTDSVTWVPLNATGTTPGSGIASSQPAGKPLYCGNRSLWGSEIADLSPFTGPSATRVDLRWRGVSDGGGNFDGLAVDSIRIVVFDPAAQPTPVAVEGGPVPGSVALAAPFPNPARGLTRFELALPRTGPARLDILDVQGRLVRRLVDGPLSAGRYVRGWDLRDDRGGSVPPGVYLARLVAPGGGAVRRIAVL